MPDPADSSHEAAILALAPRMGRHDAEDYLVRLDGRYVAALDRRDLDAARAIRAAEPAGVGPYLDELVDGIILEGPADAR